MSGRGTIRRRGVRRASALAALLACAFALAAPPVGAQRPVAPGQGEGPAARRTQLEQQVRQRFAREVRDRLRLTEDEFARLAATNRQFEQDRRELVRRERQVRLRLYQEFVKDTAADQRLVGTLIDDAIRIQRLRLDLVEQEQRELAKFLTPVQRARYLDLQEKVRRRVEQLRRQDEKRGRALGPPRRN